MSRSGGPAKAAERREPKRAASQGKTTGHVVKRTTKPGNIKSHKIAASSANPEYIVASDKSGKKAAHKASALKKK